MSSMLLYLAAAIVSLWGISHLVPTRNVVTGFGEISEDNRNIITMEWIVEGVALVLIGALVTVVTIVDPLSAGARAVYFVASGGLFVLALVSLFTGFRVKFLPFRLCPFVLALSGALVLLGALVRS